MIILENIDKNNEGLHEFFRVTHKEITN